MLLWMSTISVCSMNFYILKEVMSTEKAKISHGYEKLIFIRSTLRTDGPFVFHAKDLTFLGVFLSDVIVYNTNVSKFGTSNSYCMSFSPWVCIFQLLIRQRRGS